MPSKRRVQIVFPKEQIGEPIIYEMGKKFRVIPNVRRANINSDEGWVVMEVTGEPEEIEKALEDLRSKNIKVSPVEGDLLEG